MRINEILSELTFRGSKCTKDCSGHLAGYKWGMAHKGTCDSHSSSFNNGCKIAADQKLQTNPIRPKIRDEKGRFSPNPAPRGSINKTIPK